jgi:hypothetical protein
MNPNSPDGSVERANWGFADLLNWLLNIGMRPTGDASFGEKWSTWELAKTLGVSQRTVRNWQSGHAIPRKIEPLVLVLFDDDLSSSKVRHQLEQAYRNARGDNKFKGIISSSRSHKLTPYRVFIGIPEGLDDIRDAFREKLESFNKFYAEAFGVSFKPVGWETLTAVGRPQEVINAGLRDCDAAVFVFHDRWVLMKTTSLSSGVEEEWHIANRLYQKGRIKHVALFLQKSNQRHLINPGKQLKAALRFKTSVSGAVSYKEFSKIGEFTGQLQNLLSVWLRRHLSHSERRERSLRKPHPTIESAVASKAEPSALENVREIIGFHWTSNKRIRIVPGSGFPPVLPLPSSKRDHADRLAACRSLAENLREILDQKQFELLDEYRECLGRYLSALPLKADPESNFLPADNEARYIRALFAAQVETLGRTFALRLQIFLQTHQGLRVFYPSLERFYQDVRNGRIQEALPIDAIESFVEGVENHTPTIFDPEIKSAFSENAAVVPMALESTTEAPRAKDASHPRPPPDPLGEIDPRKSRDYTFASMANSLWRVLAKGKEVSDSVKGWKGAYEALKGPFGTIAEWLSRFSGVDGQGGPPMPPTFPT